MVEVRSSSTDDTTLNQQEWEAVFSKKDFSRVVSKRRGKRRFQLSVGSDILDLQLSGELPLSVFNLFCFLGKNVAYDNLVYLTTKEIQEGTGYVRQTVSDGLKTLETKALIRKVKSKVKRGDRYYRINPRYFFKGYYPRRTEVIKEWVRMSILEV